MKGRAVILDRLNGREAAALLVDGQLQDLLIDQPDDAAPRPGAIYRAIAERPLKGQNGMMLRLGAGQKGFLRQARGLAPGQGMLVQILSVAEGGKATPATQRLLFKGRHVILTPGARGFNIARSIRDEALRDSLLECAHEAMEGATSDLGLILRSAAEEAHMDEIAQEITTLKTLAAEVLGEPTDAPPALLMEAPHAHYLAWRDWSLPAPDLVHEAPGGFHDHGIDERIAELTQPRVPLGRSAFMFVEPTRALVSVDVNTGGDFSFAAGLKANLAAVRDLPRQLRLRGLGGQIVIDFAPMAKKERRSIEQALSRALKSDPVETALVGWTPLGHLELQRKRERRALADLLPAD